MQQEKKALTFFLEPEIRVLDVKSFEDMHISEASVKSLIPKDFDIAINTDVLPVVFNLAVVNQINKNGDSITANAAIECVKRFSNKPINIEHKRHKIVGHIINASLAEKEFDFNDNDLNQFKNKKEPFYITAAGLIYKKIFPELAQAIIDASQSDNPNYQSISTSWEIGFQKFSIVKGGRNLQDCEYVDAKDFPEYKGYIKSFGGDGFDNNGNMVGRVVNDSVSPLGAGLVMQPAAAVEGVYVAQDFLKNKKNTKKTAIEQKNSQKTKNDVKNVKANIFNMNEEQFEEFTNKVVESVATVIRKESEAKSVGQIMRDALMESGENWKSKIKQEAEARQKVEQDLEAAKLEASKVKKDLEEIQKTVEAKAAVDLFNDRMGFFDETYDLSDSENGIIAEDLKVVDASDEAFAAYKEKVAVLFGHKNKEFIKQQEAEAKTKFEEAIAKELEKRKSVATDHQEKNQEEKNLEAEAGENALPNSNQQQTIKETLAEKVAKNFKVKIS